MTSTIPSPSTGANPDSWASLRSRIHESPESFSFLQLVRLLEAGALGSQGGEGSPTLRFRGDLSLAFPPSEVRSLEPGEDRLELVVSCFALGGQGGALPGVYTEALLSALARGEGAGADFLDVLQHPLTTLFYRGSTRHRPLWGSQSRGASPHRRALRALMGRRDDSVASEGGEACLAQAHRLRGRAPSLGTLRGLLRAHLGPIPHRVTPFQGHWLGVEPTSLAGLQRGGPPLGRGSLLGPRVWDVQGLILLELGPLDLSQFCDFLPGSEALKACVSLVETASAGRLGITLRLILKEGEGGAASLSSGARLGRRGWLGARRGVFMFEFGAGCTSPRRGRWKAE